MVKANFDIRTPDGWSERETKLLLIGTVLASRCSILESRIEALAEAIHQVRAGVPNNMSDTERTAQVLANEYAATQAGIDLVSSIFQDVSIQAKV